MTAHALKGDREKCFEAGMDDYIAKPLSRKNLLAMVEKWIKKIADCGLRNADLKSLPAIVPRFGTQARRAGAIRNPQSAKKGLQ